MAGDRRVGQDRQAPGRRHGRVAQTIFAHEGFVLNLAFSPDSRRPRHDERGPERQALGGSFRPAVSTFHGHADFV